MTSLSEQLETIFQEITASFTLHQQIQVVPIAGDPPEQYRITYRLQGLCKREDGSIEECSNHVITLTLPFGFPHFPPNCKPESPVFHPDFDQAAICIGEFWEHSQSLSELILHIGRMLCGEIYSTNNAFNEEAATWYKEHQGKLPLDILLALPSGSTGPAPEGLASIEQQLTTLDEVDFPDEETSSLDDEAFDKPIDPTLLHKLAIDHSYGADLDQGGPPPMDSETQKKYDEAQTKHQEGEEFEHQGQPAMALKRYYAVKNLIPDYPDIDKDISRAEYALEMFGSWTPEEATEENSDLSETKTTQKKEVPPPVTPKKPTVPLAGKRIGLPAIALISGCATLVIVLASVYLFFNSQYHKAQILRDECKGMIESGRFTDADQKCTEAMEATNATLFIKQKDKKLLTVEIKQLQSSPKLQEGLAVLGKEAASNTPEWQQALNIADKKMAESKWKEAQAGYTHALQFSADIAAADRALLDQVYSKAATAQCNLFIQSGERAMAEADWETAQKHFDKAGTFARQNPLISPDVLTRIKSLTEQIKFNKLMATGESYFGKEDWANALTTFKQAEEIEKKISFADAATATALKEVIIRTKVFNALEQGKKAFTEAQWDQAIAHYETAIQLLEENSETLRHDNPEQSQQKISKLLLHAAVIRDKQSAAGHLKNKDFPQAIHKLQALIETINMSAFAQEQEFQTIIKETKNSISQAQEELLLAEQIDYLTTNYQKLFTQNNSTLVASNLSRPRATFLKRVDNKLLFKLQCFEEGHGRPVLLQISYLYDPATKKWRFYNSDATSTEQEGVEEGQKLLSSIYQSQESRLIKDQAAYLTKNFQSLLIRDHPDLHRENLSKPQAVFIRKIGEKLLFMLQYFNQDSETPALLKANYLYDPASNQWQLYSDKNS